MNIWKDRSWSPMLLKEIAKPFNNNDYIYEIKFDGIRACIFVSPKSFQIISRNNVDITYLYPELRSIQDLVDKETIFDGEIVSFENGKPSFSKLQERSHLKNNERINLESRKNPVTYICFDILYQGKNITSLKQIQRKKILNKYKDGDYFCKSKFFSNGISLFENIKKLNLEGIVAKRKYDSYEINSRNNSWIKIKNFKKGLFRILGYERKKGNYISLILGEKKGKKYEYIGKVSLSENSDLYKKVIISKKVVGKKINGYKNKGSIFITSNLLCPVKYLERTKNNHLRQPVIDKDGKDE